MKEKKIICRSLSFLLSAASLVGCLSSTAIPAFAANHGEVMKIENLQEPMETKPGYTGPVGELIKLEDYAEELPGIKIFGEKIEFENKEEEQPTKIIPCVISMGDSFSAGEGLAPYYGSEIPQNNRVDEDWVSHRSQKSWPGQLSIPDLDNKPLSQSAHIYTKPSGSSLGKNDYFPNWFFVAVSGATTQDYWNNKVKYMFRFPGEIYEGQYCGQTTVTNERDIFSEITKLEDNFTSDKQPVEYNIEYVTMTMGGNDVDFTNVVTEAVKGSKSSLFAMLQYRLAWFEMGNKNATGEYADFLKAPVRDRLYDIYVDILERCDEINTGDDQKLIFKTHLIIAGYPHLFNADGLHVLETSGQAIVDAAYDAVTMNSMHFLDEIIDFPKFALPISSMDARNINSAIDIFNSGLAAVVDRVQTEHPEYADRIHFVAVAENFLGREAYCPNPTQEMIRQLTLLKHEDLNNIYLFANKEDLRNDLGYTLDANIFSAASAHPTSAGAEAYRKLVQQQIDAVENIRRNAIINVYITDGKQYAPAGYKVSIKDTYEKNVDVEGATEDNIAYTEALCLKAGRYMITVENGKDKMTVVRTIKDNEVAEFTFVVEQDTEKNADICLYLTDGESYIHDRVSATVRNTAGENIKLYADGNAVRSEALNPGQYLITASYGGKTLNVVREIKEGTNNFTILADRSDEKKAIIQIYATNDKKEDSLNKASFSIESVFGATPTMTKQSGSSGDSCLRSEALLPGTYRITAVHAGETMSIVRSILAGTSEFTFLIPNVHTPEETVQALEDAMNAMDQRALIACFDLDLNDVYDGAQEVIGFITDMDLSWVDGASTVLGGIMAQMGLMPKITMKPTNVTYTKEGKDCIVDILYTASMEGIGTNSEMLQLPMHFNGEYWLISMSHLNEIVSLF